MATNGESGPREIEAEKSWPFDSRILDFFRDKTVIHGVVDTYPNLSGVKQIAEYATRALLIPTQDVLYVPATESRADTEAVIQKHAAMRLGPSMVGGEVRFVTVDYATHGPAAFVRAALLDLKKRGKLMVSNLSFFGQSPDIAEQLESIVVELGELKNQVIKRFKEDVGLPPHFSADVIGGAANSKGVMRAALERVQAHDLAIPYRAYPATSDDKEPFRAWAIKYLEDTSHASLVVKAVNKATGEGITFCNSLTCIDGFVNDLREDEPELNFIVEADLRPIEHTKDGVRRIKPKERSAQFYIDDKGEPHFLGMTRQIIEGTEHAGNTVSSDTNNELNRLPIKVFEEVQKLLKFYGTDLRYKGYLSLDFIDTEKDEVKLLEVNARMTGATPVLVTLAQLKERHPDKKEIVVSSKIIAPRKDIDSFEKLDEAVGDMWYDPQNGKVEGVIPLLATGLPDKLSVMVVAESEEDVQDQLLALSARIA